MQALSRAVLRWSIISPKLTIDCCSHLPIYMMATNSTTNIDTPAESAFAKRIYVIIGEFSSIFFAFWP